MNAQASRDHSAARDPPGGRFTWVCWLLALVGGFADAGSFVLVGSFTGHVTGNILLTAIYLVTGRWLRAAYSSTAVVAFLAGTTAGTAWRRFGSDLFTRLRLPLLLEFVLIALGPLAYSFDPASGGFVFIAFVCLSLGLQNGILAKLGRVAIHSTYVTGMSTSLVGAILTHRASSTVVLATIIGLFIVGAFCGAALADRLGGTGFFAILVPLAGAVALSIRGAQISG